MTSKSVFQLQVPEAQLHPSFARLRDLPLTHPTRVMVDEAYASLVDPDGNFLQQLQTSGFDARIFELYLWMYFIRSGFEVDRTHARPDFIVTRLNQSVAVEATTTGPSTSGALSDAQRPARPLSAEQLDEYLRNELAIRFGSPLFSKLSKQYWKLDHCRNLPMVIAIEAFHDDESLTFTDAALTRYVFGIDQSGSLDVRGALSIKTDTVNLHRTQSKQVPSNFFNQPEAEHISGIMFTNAGTTGKFGRMGYQHGYGNDRFAVSRSGLAYSQDHSSLDPQLFSYNLDESPLVETWGQGLVVLHNPSALRPLSRDFFPDAVQSYMDNGVHTAEATDWHPFCSKTLFFDFADQKQKISEIAAIKWPRRVIVPITQTEFSGATGMPVTATNPILQEQGWFADESGGFYGAVVFDRADADWGYVILARDALFAFRAIAIESSLSSRADAVAGLRSRMLQLLESPQRIFVQGEQPGKPGEF